MGKTVVVRYRTRPESADENARYTTYRLDDQVSFVHVAEYGGPDNPLAGLPAFAEFQRDIAARCVEQPAPSGATIVGSYA
jgi:hypothetical protein